jgi:hypothetical protein
MDPERIDVPAGPQPARPDEAPEPPAPAGNASLTQAGCGCTEDAYPPEPEAGGPARAASHGFVYALGRVRAQFPSLGVEKEFAQVVARRKPAGLTDQELLHAVLSDPENRYLVRQLCFVLSIREIDTYILRPSDPSGYDQLIAAVRPVPSPLDLDVVIGGRGSVAPPELCNGLTVPVVTFEQIYSFHSKDLIKAVDPPEDIPAKEFRDAAADLLARLLQLGDNSGAADEHRAVNYAAVRNDRIYRKTVQLSAHGFRLSAVDVSPSRLSGTRRILDVVFSFTHREADVTEKYFVRIDVTEMFPFLRSNWTAYYDR